MECNKCLQNQVSDPDFSLNSQGVCNYCLDVEPQYNDLIHNYAKFETIIETIKSHTKGDTYHCLVGMSGGVDSSYIAHLCGKHGLNPLIVHFDNGWNSELAVNNIKVILEKYNFELHTLVVDWEEFLDLQKSLIKSDVIDIEIASDHAIYATMMSLAKKYKIKYVLSGANVATESGMPPSWSWRKGDWINMKNIHKKFGSVKLKTFPVYSSFSQFRDKLFKLGPQRIDLLNYVPYKKYEAISTLKAEYGWVEYSGKHYESIFTAFYQSYILPTKFNVDKRISHLSALIRNKEISKEEANELLNEPLFSSEKDLKIKKEYFCKKLGLSILEFDEIMARSPKPHIYYKSDQPYFDTLKRINIMLINLGLSRIVKRYVSANKSWESK